MRKVIYCKYNQSRTKKYQTKTVIVQDGEKKYIEKTNVCAEAKQHLERFRFAYENVKDMYPKVNLIDTEFDGDIVRYPYIKGKNLDDIILSGQEDKSNILIRVKEIIDTVLDISTSYFCEFEKTDLFIELFGDVDCTGIKCVQPCNIDVIFDNIIETENGTKILYDYEWVFDTPIPYAFVIYRVICHFWEKHRDIIAKSYTFAEYMNFFGYNENDVERYRTMESHFISHVYSEGEPAFSAEQYSIERMKFDVMNWNARDYDNVMKLLRDSDFIYKRMIRQKDDELNVLRKQLSEYKAAYENVIFSKSWKATKPIRATYAGMRSLKNNGIRQTINIAKTRTNNSIAASENSRAMDFWYQAEINVSEEELEAQRKTSFSDKIKFSIITPLFNTDLNYLKELLQSVISQTYANFELCLCDFSDTDNNKVGELCKEYAKLDKRIRYNGKFDNEGISNNTNKCIEYSSGDYLIMLDHDDLLHPTALYYVAKEINETKCDFVYSDEIKFSDNVEGAYAPNFKPDFSYEELRVHNYICHLCAYKKDLLSVVGGYRAEFDGSQDHDMMLRLTEKAKKISHIAKILYLWRVHQGSVALNINEKPYATIAGEKAVTEQFERLGLKTKAISIVNNIPCYKFVKSDIDCSKCAAIIWGNKETDKYEQQKECLQRMGIDEKNIVVVCEEKCKNDIIDYSGDSLGDLWNCAMKRLKSEWVLFVYANISSISENAVKEMMVYCDRTDIISVDAKVSTETKILSGGLQRYGDFESDLKIRCKGKQRDYSGYENAMILSRCVSASLGVFTLVNKNYWRLTRKFKANDIKSMSNYTFECLQLGGINIWSPHVEVIVDDESIVDSFESLDIVFEKKCNWTDSNLSDKVIEYGLD